MACLLLQRICFHSGCAFTVDVLSQWMCFHSKYASTRKSCGFRCLLVWQCMFPSSLISSLGLLFEPEVERQGAVEPSYHPTALIMARRTYSIRRISPPSSSLLHGFVQDARPQDRKTQHVGTGKEAPPTPTQCAHSDLTTTSPPTCRGARNGPDKRL
jgi:hypothetical protein